MKTSTAISSLLGLDTRNSNHGHPISHTRISGIRHTLLSIRPQASHIAGELLNFLGKTSLVAVHFKGGGPGLIAGISGEVITTFTNIAETSAFVRAKKLRAIGVSNLKRSPALPEVPTVDESGLAGYEFMAWFVLAAPKKTPRAVVTQLNEQMKKTLATLEQIRLFADRGLDIVASTPDYASEHLKKNGTPSACGERARDASGAIAAVV